MAVYFKFKSAKDYDSVAIEGHFISVGNLKDKIIEKKNLGRGSDFDLVISNAQTSEEHIDEGFLIPKNTSVLVRRIPGRRRMPNITEIRDEKPIADDHNVQVSMVSNGTENPEQTLSKQADESSDWADEFGMDLYATPEEVLNQSVVNKADEDSKIKAFVDASASDWQRQTQEGLNSRRGGYGRGSQGRGASGRGFGRGLEKTAPPPGYVCYRCHISGHFIQHCPTNGDPAYDIKRVKPPTGIPKSMLVANPDGSYVLPGGGVAVLRPNEAIFDKEVEGLPSNRIIGDIPPEFCCPLCTDVLKDAVLTSKCCFKSFCDKCIRDHIIQKGICVCREGSTLADDLLPNKTLRDAINGFLENAALTNSAENAGSRHIQDMESARGPLPNKQPSPSGSASASASHKKTSATLPPSDGSSAKEEIIERKPVIQLSQKPADQQSGQKKIESHEQALESMSTKEQPSQEEGFGVQSTSRVEEEVQQQNPESGKKRKPKKKGQRFGPVQRGNEMQWRANTNGEFMLDGSMVPYNGGNPMMYGNFWGAPQWPVDGCLQSYPPYIGYGAPGYEMQYGAMVAPEVYSNAFMQPVPSFQRDCVEYRKGNFASGLGILSREEFEAKKAEIKRKKELEQRIDDREVAKDLNSQQQQGESSSRTKRKTSMVGAIQVRKELEEADDTTTERRSTGASLSPRPVRSRHHQDADSKPYRETTSTSVLDSHHHHASSNGGAGGGDSVRLEKRPKGSVFSRISYPERTRAERHSDVEAQNYDVGLKRTRTNGVIEKSSAEIEVSERSKHHGMAQRGRKVANGKRIEYEDERLLTSKKSANGRAYDDYESSDDEERQMYYGSMQDNERKINKESKKKLARIGRI